MSARATRHLHGGIRAVVTGRASRRRSSPCRQSGNPDLPGQGPRSEPQRQIGQAEQDALGAGSGEVFAVGLGSGISDGVDSHSARLLCAHRPVGDERVLIGVGPERMYRLVKKRAQVLDRRGPEPSGREDMLHLVAEPEPGQPGFDGFLRLSADDYRDTARNHGIRQ